MIRWASSTLELVQHTHDCFEELRALRMDVNDFPQNSDKYKHYRTSTNPYNGTLTVETILVKEVTEEIFNEIRTLANYKTEKEFKESFQVEMCPREESPCSYLILIRTKADNKLVSATSVDKLPNGISGKRYVYAEGTALKSLTYGNLHLYASIKFALTEKKQFLYPGVYSPHVQKLKWKEEFLQYFDINTYNHETEKWSFIATEKKELRLAKEKELREIALRPLSLKKELKRLKFLDEKAERKEKQKEAKEKKEKEERLATKAMEQAKKK